MGVVAEPARRVPYAVESRSVLDTLGPQLDDLHAAVGTHVMARRPWLQACADHDRRYTPLAVVVPGAGEGLDAAALLAVRTRRRRADVVALGHGRSDTAAFAARSPAAAAALADAIVATVKARHHRWRIVVRHVQRGDPVAARIAASVRHGWLVDDDVSPRLVLTPGRDLRSYVGRKYLKNQRGRLRRIAELGSPLVRAVTRDHDTIAAALPDIEEIGRLRDQAMGRAGLVATPEGASLFRDVVLAHARLGRMLLVTARIDDVLVGYALCFLDDGVARVWNCRFDPAWAPYGVGQACRATLIEHAITEGMTDVDWMLGNEPYKASLSNDVCAAEGLFAMSGLVSAETTRLGLAVRALARRATDDDADPPRWVRFVRRVGRPILGS